MNTFADDTLEFLLLFSYSEDDFGRIRDKLAKVTDLHLNAKPLSAATMHIEQNVNDTPASAPAYVFFFIYIEARPSSY